jgi:hypothetical protein
MPDKELIQVPPTNLRIQKLLNFHYLLMEDKSFWYDKALQEASKILCKAASDERQKLIAKQKQEQDAKK